MKCLERPDGARELHVLELRQRIDALGTPLAQHPGRGRVVIERALQGIHDLIVERRLGLLRQATHENLDALGCSDPPDPLGRDDVDHPGRETAVRYDRDPLLLRGGVQRLLLLDDFGVATQIGAVQAHRDGGFRNGIVEVVGQRVHDGVVAAHQFSQPRPALRIEARHDEPFVFLLLEEGRRAPRMEVVRSRTASHGTRPTQPSRSQGQATRA